MAVTCENCGTSRHVRRAFVTMWNGNVLDLCRVCAEPLARLIDGINLAAARRDQDRAPSDQGRS